MGGCDSKASKGSTSKPKAKPKKDYVFSKQTDAVLIKKEGTIDGEQFNIEECKNCDIFLLDTIATSFVDDCHNCRVFIGPVETSVFIRNCTNCSACSALDVMSMLSLSHLECGASVRLCDCLLEPESPLPCCEIVSPRLKLRELAAGFLHLLAPLKGQQSGDSRDISQQRKPDADESGPRKETSFVVFLPDSETFVEACQLVTSVSEAENLSGFPFEGNSEVVDLPGKVNGAAGPQSADAIRSSDMCSGSQEEQLKTFFAWAKEPKLASRCKGQEMTGIQVCGQDVQQQVQDALTLTGMATGAKNIRIIPEKDTEALAKSFFETWKDEV
eukprot:s1787_g4.t1